jgi:hypothetical protein
MLQQLPDPAAMQSAEETAQYTDHLNAVLQGATTKIFIRTSEQLH